MTYITSLLSTDIRLRSAKFLTAHHNVLQFSGKYLTHVRAPPQQNWQCCRALLSFHSSSLRTKTSILKPMPATPRQSRLLKQPRHRVYECTESLCHRIRATWMWRRSRSRKYYQYIWDKSFTFLRRSTEWRPGYRVKLLYIGWSS